MIEVSDKDVLGQYLCTDPIANAYQLGDLDPNYFDFCRWFATRDHAGNLNALALLYSGLSLPTLLTSGEAQGVTDILRSARKQLPSRFMFHAWPEHMAGLKLFYKVGESRHMLRMALRRADFVPAAKSYDVVNLGHKDTADIVQLYRHYPDNFFEPFMLESGLYFGIRIDGTLATIAGIHVLCEEHGIAAIGNLVTDPAHRGKGLATVCTSHLLTALFERVGLVALNTVENNTPAQRTFQKLGFSTHMTYVEGRVGA